MSTLSPNMMNVVACVLKSGEELQIGDPPTSCVDIEIARTVLKKDLQRFGFCFANERRNFVSSA
jgi:hypothetical protein